jgi:hypothetical protein
VNEEWDAARYEREKWAFIETRRRWRSLYLHTAVIFTATWLAGWLCSALLLRLGMAHLPLRYALSFAVAYAVFILCVRIWAGRLVRNTWLAAALVLAGLTTVAASVQARAPGATTFAEALQVIMARR